MKLPLKEPLYASYLYLSPENIVHIFMPIVSGTTIGLDNTCKAVYALQDFFDKGSHSNKKASLKAKLLTYKEALESDIYLLQADLALAQQKKDRLAQIDGYLKVLNLVEPHPEIDCLKESFPRYPRPLEDMMQDRAKSNLYSMVLRPSDQDGYLRSEATNPIFRVAHRSTSSNIDPGESVFQKALIDKYNSLRFSVHDVKADLTRVVLTQFNTTNKPHTFDTLRSLLQYTIEKEFGVTLDFTQTTSGEPITQDYIDKTMYYDGEATPEYYIEALLNCCAQNLFTTVIVSPFKYLTQVEQWSIATQFLLGLTNIYAVGKGKASQDTNWGSILDKHPDLSTELAQILADAQQDNASIEEVCLLWINKHAHELKLTTPFTPEDIKTIKKDFAERYVQIKDAPHFDEFFILDTEKKGAFVMHQGSICTSFAMFVRSPLLNVPQELIQPLEKALQQAPQLSGTIPHKNTLVQNEVEINTSTLDKAGLQALYERIDSYKDSKLKEQLFAQLKTERPDFKPQINVKQFLQHVAYGQQNEAENLLKKDAALAQELLTARDIELTDYSGRTFKCGAYEYAWWAKDSHMRFMLERHMNEDTKKELLKRVQQIEELIETGTLFKKPRGLAYTQKGEEYRSAHFDLTPLKSALRTYIEAYKQSPKQTEADWGALDAAWIKVGLPQREVPAHIAQEYCHPKRSFEEVVFNNLSLLDASNPANLDRQLKFYNWNTRSDDDWFTSAAIPDVSGLGSSCAIFRAGALLGAQGGGEGMPGAMSAGGPPLDLSAIEAIDEARTKELKGSLEHLAAPPNSQAPNPHGS